ncbi:histidine kinase [Crocinitomix catalasitica]|uniref:histidine kinase n=1 Tax=Crocinitomix catalasitica TaxID=184607 RepID=UPI000486151E|nr:histidine kinase [Crocinitomix catalasitica]
MGQAQYDFHNFNSEDGLPSAEVYFCLQDNGGFMWFATDQGVARYNGFEFEIFTIRDGLTDNVIIDLEKDQFGKIWFIGLNGSLSFFDEGRIIPYQFNDHIKVGGNEKKKRINYIKSIFVSKEGDVTLGSVYSRSMKISADGKITYFTAANKNVCLIYDRDIDNGTLLYTGSDRDLKLKNSIQILEKGAVVGSTEFEGLDITHTMATKIEGKGFVLNQSNELKYFQDSLIIISPLDYYILHTRYDGEFLWVGTICGGLLKLKFVDGSFKLIDQYLKDKNVSSSYRDKNGSIWLTTTNNGVYYLINDHTVNYYVANDKITDIAVSDSILYISNLSGKVYGWNLENNKLIQTEVFDSYIDEINAYKDGLIVSGKELHFINVNRKEKIKSGLTMSHLNIAGNRAGPLIFYSSSNLFYTRDLTDFKRIYEGRTFDNICYDDSTIVSGVDDGIIRIDTLGNVEKIYTGDRIIKLSNSNFGLIALSIKSEVLIINEDNVQAYRFDDKGEYIKSFLIDDDCLWLVGNIGLIRLSKNSQDEFVKETFLLSDGLLSNEIFKIAATKDLIILASKKGVQSFPKKELKKLNSGKLSIENVVIDGESIDYSKTLEIKYDQNNMEVVLSALMINALGSKNIEYQINNKLFKTNNSRISLTNLAPGNYVLNFRLKNDNWEELIAQTTLKFTIKKPFWNTVWFYFLCALLISLSTFVIVKNLFDKQKQRLRQNDLLVSYQQKALLAQMKPHFIYNSLNSIQTQVLKSDKFEAHKYISKFGELIRKNLEWSEFELILLKEELELIQLYVDLEQKRMAKQIVFDVVLSVDIDIEKVRIPPFIIQPIIENSFWHGINLPSIENGKINLEITLANDYLHFTVVDNGIGIDAAMKMNKEKHLSMSSKITMKRIQLLESKYNFNANYSIVDLRNEGATGTKVEFILPKFYA